MLGFCSSPRFTEHQTTLAHPERPDRIRAIWTALREAGFIDSNPFPDFTLDLGPLPQAKHKAVELAFGPAANQWIASVHTRRHIEYVERMSLLGGGILDQGDTPVGPESYEIALLAVGAVLRSCDAVMKGEAKRCFAAVRPPGHHADPDRPMGFCLFSNVAIAAKYLQQAHGIKRVAIVDFDVHHGNGTQACFEDDPSVFFCSLHQHPHTAYPGSGFDWEIGVGPGKGFTKNIGFNPGAGDDEYLSVIETQVIPDLERFRPEVLLLSAGFDGHKDDPLAQINLTDDGFERITRALAAQSDHHCHGRIVSVLEGGYNLLALGRSVVRHLIGLGG
jgi:acetoin utilization deacetylase AcuC-like enzyme